MAEEEAEARAKAQSEAELQRTLAEGERAAADEQRIIAEDQRAIAQDEARAALEAYSLSLSTHGQKALDELDSGTALALALAASDIENPPREVVQTLERAAFAPGARRQFEVANEHGEPVDAWSVEISPDGSKALIGPGNGGIVLLDIESGLTTYPFNGHGESVASLKSSPDGSRVLSASCDTGAILWDLATGEEIQRFSEHTGCISALDFTPDGKSAISGSWAGPTVEYLYESGQLFLWDLESGYLIRSFEGGHLYGVESVAISQDGRTLLSGEYNGEACCGGHPSSPLILWDLESGEIIHRFPATPDFVYQLPSIPTAVQLSPQQRTRFSNGI